MNLTVRPSRFFASFSLRYLKTGLLLTGLAFFGFSCTPGQQSEEGGEEEMVALPAADPDNGGISLPNDFGAVAVADSVGRARHIAVDENGTMYIKLRRPTDEGHGVIILKDSDGDGKFDQKSGFANYGGTGVEVYKNYLYVSSDSSVFRYDLSQGDLTEASQPDTIITDFPNQRPHAAKPMAFDDKGKMYVTVGAPSNACMEQARTKGSPGMDPCPQLERHAGIWQFDAEKTGQTQMGDGYHYATGIRHAVAIHWNSAVGELYAVQHGRDQLSALYPDLYTEKDNAELPSEEFLKVTKDADFGWPYCYYDHRQNKKVQAPEYGGNGQEVGRCADVPAPEMAFPGHMAPNDLLFYTGDLFPERYKNGAFIAFHGSWNRAPLPQKGYFVVFVPFENGKPAGEWEVFAEGFAGQEEVANPGDAEHRPMGLAQGPDGSLYITDSVKGKIWRVMYYGQQMAMK